MLQLSPTGGQRESRIHQGQIWLLTQVCGQPRRLSLQSLGAASRDDKRQGGKLH